MTMDGLPAAARQNLPVRHSQQRPCLRFHRYRRMRNKAVARTVVPQARRILNSQNMKPRHTRGRGRSRMTDNLTHRHSRIAKKTTDPNLARTRTAETANRYPALTDRDKTLMQKRTRLRQTQTCLSQKVIRQ